MHNHLHHNDLMQQKVTELYRDKGKSGELQCIVGDQDTSKIVIGYQGNKLATFDLTKTIVNQEVCMKSKMWYVAMLCNWPSF